MSKPKIYFDHDQDTIPGALGITADRAKEIEAEAVKIMLLHDFASVRMEEVYRICESTQEVLLAVHILASMVGEMKGAKEGMGRGFTALHFDLGSVSPEDVKEGKMPDHVRKVLDEIKKMLRGNG